METGQWVVQIVGPSLAAVTLAFGGAPVAFLVDSASFTASALILRHLRRVIAAPRAPGREAVAAQAGAEAGARGGRLASHWDDFTEGVRIIWRAREIRALLLASYGVAFMTACTNYGLIFLIARSLSLGTSSLGYVYSLNGVVAVVAAAAVTVLVKPAFLGRVMAASMAGLCLAQVVMGVAPDLWVLGVGVAISAAANAPYNVSVTSLYMSRIPAGFLGRVEGIDTMVDNLVSVLGFGAAAALVLLWGPRAVFLVSAVAAVPSLVVACTRVAAADRAPGKPESPAGEVPAGEVTVA
jgi:hypothetical protein